ncbi:reverse transcriptase-like protein [Rossellomorea vietnamensis]|uniref:Reverse transcriptase-like protein n=1 Tax=Rossellomorea vietnamensis TaxID=218284 RepID=A0ACD4C8R7_9BACI|nr:reverse transcriptase-like protein [Rossellomorea vietnamensis]UXH44711.1 reverse transcriptase-like protein [Rossellomorea vietnamensis]
MLEVYIDGASAGNPGPSGAGIFIKYNGKVEKYSIPLGIMDNHEAEFLACKKALEICLEKQTDTVWLKSDSQAVVHAIEKEFVRNAQYKLLLGDILSLTKQLNLFFVKWIPSKENKAADELARKAIHLN